MAGGGGRLGVQVGGSGVGESAEGVNGCQVGEEIGGVGESTEGVSGCQVGEEVGGRV